MCVSLLFRALKHAVPVSQLFGKVGCGGRGGGRGKPLVRSQQHHRVTVPTDAFLTVSQIPNHKQAFEISHGN